MGGSKHKVRTKIPVLWIKNVIGIENFIKKKNTRLDSSKTIHYHQSW